MRRIKVDKCRNYTNGIGVRKFLQSRPTYFSPTVTETEKYNIVELETKPEQQIK